MTTHTPLLIIGTGFAGVGLATKLKRRGYDDFIMIERADDVGGTWRDNRYPGAACDVPSHLYSYSFALKSDWSRVFAPAPEIWEYIRQCARDEGLLSHIHFNTTLLEASWDESSALWRVVTSNGEYTADVVVTAMGHLADEKYPAIEGIESFTGEKFHSARWAHDAQLDGKRIAVVGSGASAVQIIPEMAKIAGQLVVFQRSAPYVIPRPDRAYTEAEKRRFARDPESMEALRSEMFWGMENNYAQRRAIPRSIHEAYKVANGHREAQVSDPDILAKVTPDYEIGCKRVLISDVYYPALQAPNVQIEAAALEKVDGKTLISTAGNAYEVDAVIFATGFEAIEPPFAPLIHGRGGQSLSEYWSQGMQALDSTTVTGFPNLFIMNGPNTGLGHNSVIFVIESQIDYINGALQYMSEQGATVLEARPEAEADYVDAVSDRAAGTVWLNGGCKNWYVDYRTNRLTVTWPDFAYAFRDSNGEFVPEHYLTA
jgi:cation diffusion facilitator CzcD-associated flavoprotein CzcO